MNIEKLNDQEKSVMLATLVGWLTTDEYFHSYFPPNGKGGSVNHTKGYSDTDIFNKSTATRLLPNCKTLYDSANMSLAWRILNWMYVLDKDGKMSNGTILGNYLMWQIEVGFSLEHMPPADAQRAWLDKILEFAIEAGMVENDT